MTDATLAALATITASTAAGKTGTPVKLHANLVGSLAR